ncbi:beta-ketoacyl reductase, partial [Streptomyces javensis]|uniref:type I polyketide synthase n=1 Tax=Streptomyces javensis TaxID=114698 RepID=UPI0031DD3FCD
VRWWLGEERLLGSRLVVATCGAVATEAGEDVADLVQAPVWGLLRSVQTESPGRFLLLDHDPDHEISPTAADVVVRVLAAGEEPQLAVRGATVLVPRLSRIAKPAAASGASAPLVSGGTVLVTGASGALAGVVARHLVAEHGVEHLLLASRRGPDAPGTVELVAELEAAGASVTVAACDVGDRDAVRELLAAVPAQLPLRGVVHTAAVVDDGVVEGLSDERVQRVLAPKVDGAWHLHELTRDMGLEAFVLYSSVAATLGAGGQSSYAAANAFLDALAQHRHAQGLPALSLAWGRIAQERSAGLLDAALETERPHVLSMKVDLKATRKRADAVPALMRGLVRAPHRKAAAGQQSAEAWKEQMALTAPEEREQLLLDLVLTHAASVLGHSGHTGIEPDRALKELGFDSLTAVELRNQLSTTTGMRLPATLVFDHPTPLAVAHYLDSQVRGVGQSETNMSARTVLAEFDKLEVTLSRLRYREDERAQISARLKGLILALGDSRLDDGAQARSDDLESADMDQVLKLLNDELGTF